MVHLCENIDSTPTEYDNMHIEYFPVFLTQHMILLYVIFV